MREWIDSSPIVDVVDAEYVRLLGYPIGRTLEGRARELAEQTRAWYRDHGQPWLYMRELTSVEIDGDAIVLEGVRFRSGYVLRQFRQVQAHGGFLIAVSAGPQCEARAQELWKEGKPDEYFFMEMFGGAVVEHLVMQAGARLCAWADKQGMMALPHYSPGYPEWDVVEQVALLDLVRAKARQPWPQALECFDTGMLRPKKSLIGLAGVTREVEKAAAMTSLVPCQRCSLPDCDYRRRPYFFNELDVNIMDTNGSEENPVQEQQRPEETGGLSEGMAYQTNVRALRKWSEERLELHENADGTVAARFRYEGSTCSNMGHPLRFFYSIRIGRPESGFRVLETRCESAEGESGYEKMCEYLKRGSAFMDDIHEEAPLLGEPLEALADWKPDSSYAGCYCEPEARDHKWRMAYEVVHFALVQRQKARRAEFAQAK